MTQVVVPAIAFALLSLRCISTQADASRRQDVGCVFASEFSFARLGVLWVALVELSAVCITGSSMLTETGFRVV